MTLQQTGVDFNSDDTLRLSLGVYLGTSSAARANVKVRAYQWYEAQCDQQQHLHNDGGR